VRALTLAKRLKSESLLGAPVDVPFTEHLQFDCWLGVKRMNRATALNVGELFMIAAVMVGPFGVLCKADLKDV